MIHCSQANSTSSCLALSWFKVRGNLFKDLPNCWSTLPWSSTATLRLEPSQLCFKGLSFRKPKILCHRKAGQIWQRNNGFEFSKNHFWICICRNDGNIAGLLKMQMSRQMLQEWYVRRKEAIRPWATFFATNKFKQPLSAQRLPRRVVKNVEYFQSNYLFVFIGLFLYCL